MANQKMTPLEARAQTLMTDSMKTGFGIVGPADRDALRLFPAGPIRFIPVAHQNP